MTKQNAKRTTLMTHAEREKQAKRMAEWHKRNPHGGFFSKQQPSNGRQTVRMEYGMKVSG